MRHAHFLVLTGRLNEFPLHELVETLRGQRKTGRLLVEFKAGPCALYFRDGALSEATLGSLRGLEALSLALSLQEEEAAPFNFNPLVTPPEAPGTQPPSADAAAFARESAAQARARVIEVEPEPAPARAGGREGVAGLGHRAAAPQLEASPESARPRALLPAAEEGALVERLARIEAGMATQARRANVERAVYAAIIALLVVAALLWRGRDSAGDPAAAGVAGLSARTPAAQQTSAQGEGGPAAKPEAALAAKGGSVPKATAAEGRTAASPAQSAAAGQAEPSSPAQPAPQTTRTADAQARRPSPAEQGPEAAKAPAARERGHVVQVRMTVVRGRVLRAEVSNPRPGMSAYEALALRMARQRRYPEEFSGQETLRLSVGR